jgi:hypothetical protein
MGRGLGYTPEEGDTERVMSVYAPEPAMVANQAA